MKLRGMCAKALNYAGYAFPAEGLGPGKRVVMWVRGCRRGCVGCVAPDLQTPGQPTPIDDIVEQLAPALARADGLSISGGEPFDQAEALSCLLDRLRARTVVEVLVYSGYLYEELMKRDDASRELLRRLDLLVDGPFLQDEPNTLQWRGSDNQRVLLLSQQAQQYQEIKDTLMPERRPLHIYQITPGHYRLIGIPRRGDLLAFQQQMAARGFEVRSKE
ncbi:MAG TPA: 4Fe-4S single cluster domain-containing protein [Armatimonadota bacterium]